jgi:hypothetical protein
MTTPMPANNQLANATVSGSVEVATAGRWGPGFDRLGADGGGGSACEGGRARNGAVGAEGAGGGAGALRGCCWSQAVASL